MKIVQSVRLGIINDEGAYIPQCLPIAVEGHFVEMSWMSVASIAPTVRSIQRGEQQEIAIACAMYAMYVIKVRKLD
jgi:hypothetical protein